MKMNFNYFTKDEMARHKKNEHKILGWMALRFYLLASFGTFLAIE